MKSEKLSDSGDSHCIRYIKGITSFITSLKNWNQILVLLITGCILLTSHISYSQVVSEGAAVKANFGIDADLYANRQQVGNMIAPNVDDWFFSSTWPGTGEGVIDQTNSASLKSSIQGNNNYSFVKRMSKPRNTIVNGITWIDAVYVRDNNSIGGNKDATVFTGTKDKNGDNPSSWNLGSGGTPPKNDIIDAFGHMRMDSDGVWGIGALTKISEDGTSHADFEFFSGQLTLNGGGTLTGIGPDAGHTAWKFNADGSIISAGDLIVIINFTNGGTVPNFSVRVWISETDRINFNARPNRTFDLTGEFNSGLNAAGFGYAEITGKNGAVDPSVWAIVNVGTSTIGAPWGTLVGSQASYAENIIALQYMEFAINLTKLGLEGFGGVGCNKVLGSLMVKTRSSAEFTAELKDFVGPFLFGFELITDLNLTPTHATCNGGTGSISTEIVGAPLNDFQIQLDSGAWVNVTSSPYVFNNVSAGSHTVSVRRISDNTCMATKSTNINEPDALGLVLTPTHATCFGGAKSISAAVTGTPLSDLEIRLDDGTWAAVTASPVVFNGVASGAHTVALRRISDNSCMTSQQTTVNEPDALDLVLSPGDKTCIGQTDGSISAAVTGTPLSDLEIRLDDGTWAAVTASPVMFTGLAGGIHTITVRRISDYTCLIAKETTVIEEPCDNLICTYTQGFYGNAGGIACTEEGSFTSLQLIQRSLDNMDGVIDNIGSMYIGLAGNSFTVSYTNANNLIGLLPGGGDISVLMADYNYMNVPLNKQNRIKNGLLAQTIVLGLNLNMHTDASNSVGNFVLEGGKYLVTVKRAASSTCEDPLMADCAIELNAMKSWMIPANVVDALPAPKDVWALYKLASDALGGAVLPVGVSLNDIHMTVDRINNAFDNCRYFLRWSDVNEVCPIPIIEPVISSEPSIETRVAEVNTVGFEVYPVPFENEITIKYKFDYNSFVRIEMYDSSGNVILSKVDNDGYLNKEIQLYLNMNIGKEQMYIVRLTTDRESVVKKIISTK